MPSPLSKTRLKRVSSRPVWGLLVRGSSPVWHIPSSGCVTAALCGVIVTFGCSHSADAVGKGSVANTSATMCDSQPRSSAASAASSEIRSPRPTLMSAGRRGAHAESTSPSSRPRVPAYAEDKAGMAGQRGRSG